MRITSTLLLAGATLLSCPSAVRAADAALPVTLYGAMEYSDAWYAGRVPARATGIYSFSVDAFDGFHAASPTSSSNTVSFSGAWNDGTFYYLGGEVGGSYANVTFNRRDTHSWDLLSTDTYSEFPSQHNVLALAVNPLDGTMWAVCDNGRVNYELTYALRQLNPANGEVVSTVGVMDHGVTAMAFDAKGRLWGIGMGGGYPTKAVLYAIDPQTAAMTQVGELGVNQKAQMTAMAFDYRTGDLYWTGKTYTANQYYEESYRTILAKVDTSTGAATEVALFDANQQFPAMWMVAPHPLAPEAAAYLAVESGALAFTLPSKAYALGETLALPLSAEVSVNGTVVQTLSNLQPGDRKTSDALTGLNAGALNVLAVTVIDAQGRRSLPASTDYYLGTDVPGPVTEVTATVTADGRTATVSWTAPTVGQSGTPLSAEDLTYRVVRLPGNVEVAAGITQTTVADTPSSPMAKTQYGVYASNASGESKVAGSPVVRVGQPYSIPYTMTFDSRTEFDTFTTIDANHDATSGGNYWMFWPDRLMAVWWIDYDVYNQVCDDWIITPTLELRPDRVYQLDYDTQGFSSGEGSKTQWHVFSGADATAEALRTPVLQESYVAKKDVRRHISGLWVPAQGDNRVGFHATNDGLDHVPLDNIAIQEYATVNCPAGATGLTAVAQADGSVALGFAAPEVTVAGDPLATIAKVEVANLSTGRTLATLTSVTPGQTCTVQDAVPSAGVNTYQVVASTTAEPGWPAKVTLDLTPDVPVAVTDLNINVNVDGTDATLGWKYPQDMKGQNGRVIPANALRYNVFRTLQGVVTQVGRDVQGTVFTDAGVMLGDYRQAQIKYSVVAVTDGGSGPETVKEVVMGRVYELPVAETFDYNGLSPWTWETSGYGQWAMASKGYSPLVDGVDATGVASFQCGRYDGGTGLYYSPYVDLRGMVDPVLTFYRYGNAAANAASAALRVGIVRYVSGIQQPVQWLTGPLDVHTATNGWIQETVDLKEFGDCPRASIVFQAHTDDYAASVHIDLMEIAGQLPERDLQATALHGPLTVVMGQPNAFDVDVRNYGTDPYETYTVTLTTADGREVARQTPGGLAARSDAHLTLEWTPSLDMAEGPLAVTATVEAPDDQNPANNSTTATVDVQAPNLPYVTVLDARRGADGTVELAWDEPTVRPRDPLTTDDLEAYDDFAYEDFGDWKTVDGDGAATISGIASSIGTFYWKNCSLPQAWMVFNPEVVGVTGLAAPHSGQKCLVSFAAQPPACNDDWLISPSLSGRQQTISLYAQAMHPGFGHEKMEIWVSAATDGLEDFTQLTPEAIDLNGCDWRQFTFELPAGTRYFAVHCTSQDQFGLMIDDVTYEGAQDPTDLTGFDIERDGQTVATGVADLFWSDPQPLAADANATYRVGARYAQGPALWSAPVSVQPSGVAAPGIDSAGGTVMVTVTDGLITVTGVPSGEAVLVVDIAGRTVASLRSLGTQPQGIRVAPGFYAVTAAGTSAKVMVP